jgi:hypothetical protein
LIHYVSIGSKTLRFLISDLRAVGGLALPVSNIEAVAEDSAEATVKDDEYQFAALEALQAALRYWWFVFLLAIIGGGIGWLVTLTRPPIYEATGRFSANIDYVVTGPLTQFEEDTALNGIGDVLYSNEVVKKVVDRAAAEGIHTSLVELKRSAVLERRFNVWDLRVRNPDPGVAERLANLWIDQGQAALLEGYQHAIQADHLNRYLASLESCLAEMASSEPAAGQCSSSRFLQIQAELQEAGKALYQERLASRGLFAGVLIGPVDRASGMARLVIYNRNQVVLSCCLIGFLLGIVLVQVGVPERWLAGRRRNQPERS